MSSDNRESVFKQFEDMDIPQYTKDLIEALGHVDGIEDIAFALEVCLCQHHLRELLSFIIMPKSSHDDCDEHSEEIH